MKITHTLFAFLIGLNFTVFSQTQIEFSNEFKPESEYHLTSTTVNEMAISFKAPEAFLNHLKSTGQEIDQVTKEKTTIKTITYTGTEKDGVIPIEVKYLETGKQQDGVVRVGESLKGTYTKDKVSITELPDVSRIEEIEIAREDFMNFMSDAFSLDLFDKGKLSVGESVTIITPLNVPIGPYQFTIDLESTYTLLKTKSKKAEFTIVSKVEMSSDFPEVKFEAIGDGSGKCSYDFKNKRIISRTTELAIAMTAKFSEDVEMTIIQKATTLETTKIK